MRGLRCDRILLGTAVVFLLAGPLGAIGQEANQAAQVAAVPVEAPVPQPPQAPAPAITETAAAALDPADGAIAEKIRDLLAGDSIFSVSEERQKVEAFYQKRQFAPLWVDKAVENARKASVASRLEHADADGLEAGDYKIPSFAGGTPEALAEAELKLTQAVFTYARHVQAGRFFRHLIKYEIGLPQAAPDPEQVLAKLADAADPGAALDEFSPLNEPYRRLKAMLAKIRGRSTTSELVPEGPVLRFNRRHPMDDARVPQLRGRLGVAGEASDLRYDARLADAVKEFQRANGLSANGNLDARTVHKLNGGADNRTVETIIANMERWRWYPRDLGEAHVLVNLPDFTLKVMHKGAQIWASRIVIGEPSKPTPLLSDKMTSVTLNPVWHVPPSIVKNEYLPALARDHKVLARMGLHLSYNGGEAQITMPAGGNNPLGHIRFNFYNRFMVFQHDTPDQYMFGHAVRAESHGCMRVEHASKYAEVLFNLSRPDEHWTAERVKSTFGGAEQEIPTEPAPVFIHLTYQTAFVDDEGRLQIRRDLYDIDRRTLAALKKEPVVAEPALAASHDREPASPSRHRRSAHHSQPGDVSQSPFFAVPSNARPRSTGRVSYR
jgi:murein L,D-transpeptidase YcbB/YkuD